MDYKFPNTFSLKYHTAFFYTVVTAKSAAQGYKVKKKAATRCSFKEVGGVAGEIGKFLEERCHDAYKLTPD